MKLNGILLLDQELGEFSAAVYESEIFRHNSLPPGAGEIRFKLDKPIRKAEMPDRISGGKKLELHLGDITNLGFPVDLLTVSAFRDSYVPTPGTVMESLYKCGIFVEDLSMDPELDFRENLGIWLSRPTGLEEMAQLVCLEVLGRAFSFQEALHNLFSFLSILEIRGKQPASISIPLLGTGMQGFEKSEVIPALLDESLRFLQIARAIKEIHFVVFSESDATEFSTELDAQLSKGKLQLSDGKSIGHIKKLPPGMGWMAG